MKLKEYLRELHNHINGQTKHKELPNNSVNHIHATLKQNYRASGHNNQCTEQLPEIQATLMVDHQKMILAIIIILEIQEIPDKEFLMIGNVEEILLEGPEDLEDLVMVVMIVAMEEDLIVDPVDLEDQMDLVDPADPVDQTDLVDLEIQDTLKTSIQKITTSDMVVLPAPPVLPVLLDHLTIKKMKIQTTDGHR